MDWRRVTMLIGGHHPAPHQRSSQADPGEPPPPPLHHVKYTVFTEVPFRNAEIYYRNVDPPSCAEYSHNPYVFSPNVEADLGPNQMWTIDVMLANPNDGRW